MPLVGNSFQICHYSWKPGVPLPFLKRQELQVSLMFASPPGQPVSPFLPSCRIPVMMMGGGSKETVRVRDKFS